MKKTHSTMVKCVCAMAMLFSYANVTAEKNSTSAYKPVDYSLYPTPGDDWVADVMPYANGDRLDLYYLYETDHNIQAFHPVHKFETENFFEYEDIGMTVPCGTASEPDVAIGTGSVFKAKDGLFHIFYTGHNDSFAVQGKPKECVLHAVSRDGYTWEKRKNEVLYAPEGYSNNDFRDPQVLWNEEENCYWMLVAAREEANGGVIAKFVSDDLSSWTFKGALYAPHKQYMLECPDLFKMGDKYYLFYSWDCVTYYSIGKTMNGPFMTPKDNVLDGSNFIFYAAKTAELKGKRYLCGWLGRTEEKNFDNGKYRWAGNMLIHQLVQHEDGTLGLCMPESINDHFTEAVEVAVEKTEGKVSVDGTKVEMKAAKGERAVADLGERLPTMLMECDLVMGDNGVAGFAFGNPKKNFKNYFGLVLDAKRNSIHYEGYKLAGFENVVSSDPIAQTKFTFKAGVKHHIKVVAENEIFVLYIDNKKALSNRIFNSINGAHIALYTADADATFENVTMRTAE